MDLKLKHAAYSLRFYQYAPPLPHTPDVRTDQGKGRLPKLF